MKLKVIEFTLHIHCWYKSTLFCKILHWFLLKKSVAPEECSWFLSLVAVFQCCVRWTTFCFSLFLPVSSQCMDFAWCRALFVFEYDQREHWQKRGSLVMSAVSNSTNHTLPTSLLWKVYPLLVRLFWKTKTPLMNVSVCRTAAYWESPEWSDTILSRNWQMCLVSLLIMNKAPFKSLFSAVFVCIQGLGNNGILNQYCVMRLDIILDIG